MINMRALLSRFYFVKTNAKVVHTVHIVIKRVSQEEDHLLAHSPHHKMHYNMGSLVVIQKCDSDWMLSVVEVL